MPRIFFYALILPAFGCTQRAEIQSPDAHCFRPEARANASVIARVGDEILSEEELKRRLQQQGSRGRRIQEKRRLTRRFIEDQVRVSILTQAAVERGIHHDPEVIDTARRVMVRKLLESELSSQNMNSPISEDTLQKYYERKRQDYQSPEARRVLHVELAPSSAGQSKAVDLITTLSKEKEKRKPFHQAAQKNSRHASGKEQGGELPFLSQEELTAEFGLNFARSVFELQAGSIAPAPIQSTRGWHVVKLLAVREGRELSFDEARQEIEDYLLERRRNKFFNTMVESLKNKYPVQIYQDKVDALQKSWDL